MTSVQSKSRKQVVRFVLERSGSFALLLVLALLMALPFIFDSSYLLYTMSQVLILAILALSTGFLMGGPRLVSLGQAAFYGGGAYVTGIVAIRVSENLIITMGVALIFCSVLALVFGMLSLGRANIYFLTITLALGQLVYVTAQRWIPLTGGSDGLTGIPYPALFGLVDFSEAALYYVILLFAAGAYVLLRTVMSSPFGHALLGIGSNEQRMRALGYNTYIYKLVAFVMAGALAGASGVFAAYSNGIVVPEDAHWIVSADALIMVILGGVGTLLGPMLGAALFWFLQEWLASYTPYSRLITGVVFILFIFFARQGLAGFATSIWKRVRP